jgi:hypothetical protein
LRIRHEVESAARSWDVSKHKDLLWRGARVTRARELMTNGTLLLEDSERRFIEASEHQEKVWRRSVISVLSGFTILATVLAIIAFVYASRSKSSERQAQERAKEAEIERLNALSAQNFAEHERIGARAQTAKTEDEKKALEAIAPKYKEQSVRYKEEAERLQKELENWRRENGRQAAKPDSLFTIEVFRAEEGTAFLIHHGTAESPGYILIDGGSIRTYKNVLKPRFDELRPGGKTLPLGLVVATQTDIQHIGGLIGLVEDLQQQSSADRSVTIDRLWSNAFLPGPPELTSELVKLQKKGKLVAGAKALGVPVNAPFTRMIAAPEAGSARVDLGNKLTVTVLSPQVQWLRGFAEFWLENWKREAERRDLGPQISAALNDYDILETFSDPKIELFPSPIEINNPASKPGRDRSSVNLGSLVLMLESEGKRILLTADTNSDVILSSLAQAGYTDGEGNMEVDVLLIPHGGSIRNISDEFFQRIKARHYVISANGKHTNPEIETLNKLFAARRGDNRQFTLDLTYAPEEYEEKYPVQELCDLFVRERSAGTPFEIVTPKKERNSFGIDLWSNAGAVDKGARNSVCGL